MSTQHTTLIEKPLGEPDAHVATRHMQTGIRDLLILSLVSTVLLLLFYQPAAYLAAIPVPVLLIVLVILGYLERRSRVELLRSPGQTQISQREVDLDVETIGILTVLKVLGVLAIGSFIALCTIFDFTTLGIAAATFFLISALTQFCFFPLFFLESERDEREKLTGHRD